MRVSLGKISSLFFGFGFFLLLLLNFIYSILFYHLSLKLIISYFVNHSVRRNYRYADILVEVQPKSISGETVMLEVKVADTGASK